MAAIEENILLDRVSMQIAEEGYFDILSKIKDHLFEMINFRMQSFLRVSPFSI